MSLEPVITINGKTCYTSDFIAGLSVTWGKPSLIEPPQASTATMTILEHGHWSTPQPPQIGARIKILIDQSETIVNVPVCDQSAGSVICPVGVIWSRTDTETEIKIENITDKVTVIDLYPSAPATSFTDWDKIPTFTEPFMVTLNHLEGFNYYDTVMFQTLIFDTPKSPPVLFGDISEQTLTSAYFGNVTSDWMYGEENKYFGVRVTIIRNIDTWKDLEDSWYYTSRHWVKDSETTPASLTISAWSEQYITEALSVFDGYVTEVTLTPQGNHREIRISAADQWAQLANQRVGDTPWPQETVAARAKHIFEAVDEYGVYEIPSTSTELVAARDVDSQPPTDLIVSLARSAGLDAWPASHPNLGFYVHFTPILQEINNDHVQYTWGVDYLGDACFKRTPQNAASSIIIKYKNTADLQGDDLTYRLELPEIHQVINNRSITIQTELISQQAAADLATKWRNIVNRPYWEIENLTLTGINASEEIQIALLDATTRIGQLIQLQSLASWVPYESFTIRVIGGTCTYNGHYWNQKLNSYIERTE